jgi:hypothetical protein
MGGPSHISSNLPEGLRKNMEKFQVRKFGNPWTFSESIITKFSSAGQEPSSSFLER